MTGLQALTPISGVPFVESPHVSLTRIEPDGSVVDVLVWVIGGQLVIHPERLRQLREAIRLRDLEPARWDDDGGAR